MDTSGNISIHQHQHHRARSVSLPSPYHATNPPAHFMSPPAAQSAGFSHHHQQHPHQQQQQHQQLHQPHPHVSPPVQPLQQHQPQPQQQLRMSPHASFGLPPQQQASVATARPQAVPPSWQQEEGQKRGYDPLYLRRQQQVAHLRQIFHRLSPQAQQQIRQQLLQWRQQKHMREMYKRWKLQQLHNMKVMHEQQQLQQQQQHQQQRQQQQHHHQLQQLPTHQQAQQQFRQVQLPTQQEASQQGVLTPPAQLRSPPVSAGMAAEAPAVPSFQQPIGSGTDSPKQRRLSSFRRGRIAPIKKKSFKPQGNLSLSAPVFHPSISVTPGESMDHQPSAVSMDSPSAGPAPSFQVPAPVEDHQTGQGSMGMPTFRRTRSYSDPSSTWPSPMNPQQLQQLQQMRQQEQLLHLQRQQHQQQLMQQSCIRQHPTNPGPQAVQHQQANRYNPLQQSGAGYPTHQPRSAGLQYPHAAHAAAVHLASPSGMQQSASSEFQHGQQAYQLPSTASNSEPLIPTISQRQESMELDLSASASLSLPSVPSISALAASPASTFSSSISSDCVAGLSPQQSAGAHQGSLNLGDIDELDMLSDHQFLQELSLLPPSEQGTDPQPPMADLTLGPESTSPGQSIASAADFFEELGEIISLPDDLFEAGQVLPMRSEAPANISDQSTAPSHSFLSIDEASRTPDLSSFGSPSLLPASPSLTSVFFQLNV